MATPSRGALRIDSIVSSYGQDELLSNGVTVEYP